jgi:hypothetical protein
VLGAWSRGSSIPLASTGPAAKNLFDDRANFLKVVIRAKNGETVGTPDGIDLAEMVESLNAMPTFLSR